MVAGHALSRASLEWRLVLVLEEGRQLLLRLLQEGRLMLLEERHLLVCGQDGPRHRESSCAKDGRCGHLHQRCCKWERERCRAGQRRRRS